MMFELPIVILVLSALGVVTPGFLLRHFRWAVLIIFVVAAIITPTPDVVNLCVFAVPALLLYLLGVAAAFVVAPKKKSEGDATDTPAP
jgi:sec-independent protein translocase protein TatC